MTGEILFLAHRIPYPPDRGDKIRSWHLLRAASAIAPVHVMALWDDERDLVHLDHLRSVAASVTVVPRNMSKLRAIAKGLIHHQPASVMAFDNHHLHGAVASLLATRPIKTIFAFSGQMAHYVPRDLGQRRFVMDFVDMDSAKFTGYGQHVSGPVAWANRLEGRRLFAFETAVAKRADVSLFVSAAEAALFRSQTGLGRERVAFVENGIDLATYDPAQVFEPVGGDGPLIIFTGQMDYRPNVEAVEQFARITFAKIRDAVPSAKFAIVGRAPTIAVQNLGALPGVSVTGEVPDTRAWLASADVVVAPLLLARGVQNKVLEAMAMAKPVVASPAAVLGIEACDGTHLMIGDTAHGQADAVIKLLGNTVLRHRIGTAARAQIEARYGWEARLAGLPALLGYGA